MKSKVMTIILRVINIQHLMIRKILTQQMVHQRLLKHLRLLLNLELLKFHHQHLMKKIAR